MIFTFVWTKYRLRATRPTSDWELRIIGMDEDIAGRIQEQVNSVSSLIDTPGIDQDDFDAQRSELDLERELLGSEQYLAAPPRSTRRTCDRRSSRAIRADWRWTSKNSSCKWAYREASVSCV